ACRTHHLSPMRPRAIVLRRGAAKHCSRPGFCSVGMGARQCRPPRERSRGRAVDTRRIREPDNVIAPPANTSVNGESESRRMMPKLRSMHDTIAEFVPDGSSVALGLQMEQMIPFAAGHEIIRQGKCNLTLIGPISDTLFDQLIGAGCIEKVIAAWVGNVMMGSAYNFRRAVEQDGMKVFNMTNFTIALALQA